MSEVSYQNLIVWQKSMELVKTIYTITVELPQHEKYGLSSQMQRSAVAIPNNIAEGYMRGHRKEYSQFLSIALGSAAELETQLLVYEAVYPDKESTTTLAKELNSEIIRMLIALIKKVKLA